MTTAAPLLAAELTASQAALTVQAGLAETAIVSQTVQALGANAPLDQYRHAAAETPLIASTAVASAAAIFLPPAQALAQTPQVTEALPAVVSSLPPTWQLVAGTLLYWEPILKGLSLSAQRLGVLPTREATPRTEGVQVPVRDRINGWTGAYERMIALPRDWIGMPAMTGALLAFNDQPIWMRLLEAAAVVGLTVWNRRDRFHRVEGVLDDRQLSANVTLRSEVAREIESQATGILARAIPDTFREQDLMTGLPDGRNPHVQPSSWWDSFRAVANTFSYTFRLRRAFSRLAGFKDAMRARLMTLRGEHASIHPPTIALMERVLAPQWAEDQASIYRNRTEANLEALASIPEGAPVVHVAPVHSMWPDYQFLRVRPKARFAPDEKNFWGNLLAKVTGFSAFLDIGGFGTVKRGEGQQFEPAPLVKKMVEAGTEPLFFSPGTRTPRTWTDDGRPDRPGLRGAVSDRKKGLKHPERYCNLVGAIETAIAAARATGKDAYMPVIMIEGGTEITPKWGRTFPFLQRIFRNKTIHFRVAGIVRVGADADQKTVWDEILQVVKDDTQIDSYLATLVEGWVGSDLRSRFSSRATADERYSTLVERIWTIHPDYTDADGQSRRRFFIDQLRLLLANTSPTDAEIQGLLREVSLTAKQTEYGAPWKKQKTRRFA